MMVLTKFAQSWWATDLGLWAVLRGLIESNISCFWKVIVGDGYYLLHLNIVGVVVKGVGVVPIGTFQVVDIFTEGHTEAWYSHRKGFVGKDHILRLCCNEMLRYGGGWFTFF